MSARNTRDLFMQGDDSSAKNTLAGNKTRIIQSAFASLPKTEHRSGCLFADVLHFGAFFAPPLHCVVNFRSAGALNVCVCVCVWAYSRCSGRGLPAILIGFVLLSFILNLAVFVTTYTHRKEHRRISRLSASDSNTRAHQICIYS